MLLFSLQNYKNRSDCNIPSSLFSFFKSITALCLTSFHKNKSFAFHKYQWQKSKPQQGLVFQSSIMFSHIVSFVETI